MDENLSKNGRYKRSLFVYEKWLKKIDGNILDVGCDKGYIRNFCNNEYVGIDIQGKPDIYLDLEKEKIPFSENSFECVICLDVLEHLDNLHEVVDQIIKISNTYIMLSFPNELYWIIYIKRYIKPNEREFGFYPINRHKWFVTYRQAKKFTNDICKKYNLKTVDEYIEYGVGGKKNYANKILDKIVEGVFPDIFKRGFIVLLKKESESCK